MTTGRDILLLFNYFLFACDMRTRYLQGEGPSCQPISGGRVPEAAIVSALYERAWLGELYVVVEGWNGLKLNGNDPSTWEGLKQADYLAHCQAQISAHLKTLTGEKTRRKRDGPEVDETLEDLLRRVRHKVFHFERAYLPDDVRRFEMEAAARRWPQQLHDWFVQFFAAWFQSQPANPPPVLR